MPLARTHRVALVAFGTVSFFMADDQRTIRVDLSKESLAEIATPPPKSQDEFIGVLKRHKRLFEQIATAKYEEPVPCRSECLGRSDYWRRRLRAASHLSLVSGFTLISRRCFHI
jgi:hypothetical protein